MKPGICNNDCVSRWIALRDWFSLRYFQDYHLDDTNSKLPRKRQRNDEYEAYYTDPMIDIPNSN